MKYFRFIHLCAGIIFSLFLFCEILYGEGRQIIPVNNNWEFKKTLSPNNIKSLNYEWEKVNIPHTWNSKDMQISNKFYSGDAFYRKIIFAPKNWNEKRVFIRFEGVGQIAEIYLNDKYIGRHEGSYSAFAFELTYNLKTGEENTLIVKVNNTPREDILPVNNFLFGIYGGIYRPAELIITDKLNISTLDDASPGIYIRQKNVSKAGAEISITTKIENRYKEYQNATLRSIIYNHQNKIIETVSTKIRVSPQGRQNFTQSLTIKNPHLWNAKKDPYLYKVTTSLINENNNIIDEISQPLGIRKFDIISGKGFYLNGEPYRLYGVCRHQDWWEYGNALSNMHHEQDLETIKEIGATSIRFAHYQQAEYIYSKCDSMGFIIWAEVPFVNTTTGKEYANAKQQITELIKQNYNHPSIYTWGLHNEVYCDNPAEYTARLTQEMNEIAKTLDPDRFTVSVNGHGNMDRPENLFADIQGMNRYFGWYEGKTKDISKWIESCEKLYPDYKVILAEYGFEGNIDNQLEDLPESIQYDAQFFPESYQTRCHELQWGIIKEHPYLVSSYIWNMFDFAVPLWSRGGVPARNMKGLVTFDRKQKKDAFYWYKANWNPEPMIYIADRRAKERKHDTTTIAIYSNLNNIRLYINSKEIPKSRKGFTDVHYIFENVILKKDENIITAKGERDGKEYTDTIIWNLNN